jgi:hypothetical protein
MKTAERREKRREDQARKLSKEEMTMLALIRAVRKTKRAEERTNASTQPPDGAVWVIAKNKNMPWPRLVGCGALVRRFGACGSWCRVRLPGFGGSGNSLIERE